MSEAPLSSFFNKVIEVVLSWLWGLVDLITTPIQEVINSMVVNIPSLTGYKEFLHGCIETFIPYRHMLICLGILTPVFVVNTTMSIIILIKGFIPTMGGD